MERGDLDERAEAERSPRAVTQQVAAVQAYLAAGRTCQTREDADGGGLARAVGPEEAEHGPLADVEVHAVQRPDRAVVLGEPAQGEQRTTHAITRSRYRAATRGR